MITDRQEPVAPRIRSQSRIGLQRDLVGVDKIDVKPASMEDQ